MPWQRWALSSCRRRLRCISRGCVAEEGGAGYQVALLTDLSQGVKQLIESKYWEFTLPLLPAPFPTQGGASSPCTRAALRDAPAHVSPTEEVGHSTDSVPRVPSQGWRRMKGEAGCLEFLTGRWEEEARLALLLAALKLRHLQPHTQEGCDAHCSLGHPRERARGRILRWHRAEQRRRGMLQAPRKS